MARDERSSAPGPIPTRGTVLWSLLRARTGSALPEGSIRRRLAGGVLWTTLGSVLGQGVVAVGSILLARILGIVGFGQYGILQSTIGMFSLLAGMSMGYVASQQVAESYGSDKERTGRVAGLSLVVAVITGTLVTAGLVIGARPFSREFLGSEDLAGALRIASPILLVGAVTGVLRGVLSGLELFRTQNLLMTAGAVVTVVLTIGGAWAGGLEWAMAGASVGAALSLALLGRVYVQALTRASIPLRLSWTLQETKVVWTLAVPALLNGLMVTPVVWVTNAILVNSAGGYGQMAIFNAANQWRTLLMYVPAVVLTPLLPIMTQLHTTSQYLRLRRVLLKTLALSVGAVGCLALVLGVFAERIMQLYGSEFEAGTDIFYLIMAVSVLLAAGTVVGALLSSTGAMWTGFLFNSVWAALMIGTAIVAVPQYGALGLALAYAVSYLIHTAIQFLYFWVYVRKSEARSHTPAYPKDPAEEHLWG